MHAPRRISRLTGALLALPWLLAAASSHGSEQQPLFRWEQNGRVSYGDAPPPGVAAERLQYDEAQVLQRWTPPPAGVSGLPAVYLLSRRDCHHCERLRGLLNRRRVPFQEFDVEQSAIGRRELLRLRAGEVPQLVVAGRGSTGFDEAQINQLLDAAGY